jgi:hypothetical protein
MWTPPPAGGQRAAPALRRVRPAPALPGRGRARPVTGAAARLPVTARQPLAIEAPTPVQVQIGLPVGPGDPVLVAWPSAPGAGNRLRGPAPAEAGARPEAQLWPEGAWT